MPSGYKDKAIGGGSVLRETRLRRNILLEYCGTDLRYVCPMDQDAQHLIDETVRTVEEFWNENEQPLLLSVLGSLDGGRISQYAKLRAGGLRPFLENFIADRLLVVQHSGNQTIVGVVPIGERTQETTNWDSLLEGTSSKSSPLRLHPAFWAAFRKPIDNSLERYIQVSDSVMFIDVKSDDAPQDGIHIERQYIIGLEASPEEIYETAMQWITKNKLEVSNFLHKPSFAGTSKLPSNDLLGRLILALDSQELQRTSIPMDVVAKLRRQPI